MQLAAFCLVVLLAGGCRENLATVSGLVTLDGQPLAIGQGERGSVVFHPTDQQGAPLNGLIDAAGRYELSQGSGSRVAPGEYYVAITAVQIVPPSDEQPEPAGKRITPAKYASATDSGLRVRVEPGPNQHDFELVSESPPSTPAAGRPADESGETSGDADAAAGDGGDQQRPPTADAAA